MEGKVEFGYESYLSQVRYSVVWVWLWCGVVWYGTVWEARREAVRFVLCCGVMIVICVVMIELWILNRVV